MNTTTYSQAVAAIRTYSEAKQAELDQAATKARSAHLAALRNAATEGVDEDSPAYPVAALVAQTITVGRLNDNFPTVSLPAEIRRVIVAARASRLINESVGKLRIDRDSFLCDLESFQANRDDYAAWREAKEYRDHQSWSKL